MTGRVAHIWRHPIKSHGREALETVTLTAGQTMPWDRTWAVAHEASEADGSQWEPCQNFSRCAKAPRLQAVTARLDEATGTVTLAHPDLPDLTFNPDTEGERLIEWARAIMPENRAASARIVRVPGRGMTDTDFPSISLNNLASHRAVAQRAGREISPLRWRGNLLLDGLGPWEEFEWIDRELAIGSARLRVRERIGRCLATTVDPATGQRDVEMLQLLQEGWGHRDFGVYAEVVETGQVSVGDPVELVE